MNAESSKRRQLAQQTAITQGLRRIGRGVGAVRKDRRRLAALLTIMALVLLAWPARHVLADYAPDSLMAPLWDMWAAIALTCLAVAVPTALLWAWGGPLQAGRVQDNLLRIGFVNSAGEPPTLLSVTRSTENRRVKIMEFYAIGLPVSEWLDRADKIQAALNITVAEIRCGSDNQHIRLSAAPPAAVWPTNLYWVDRKLALEDFVLTLGESVLGPVTINLAKIPHVLLGGSTGSGKTVLLKVMLRQAVHRGAEVYIADLKGGADFGPWWRESCALCYEMDPVMEVLEQFVETLEQRKVLFRESCCANIDSYNAAHHAHPLRRMIFACDEVAEIMDKTGRSKADREQIDKVVDKLSILARQGRAFGLHLFLATQRPDANLIPGQIRSNLDFKVCGRADSVLSSIIIDSTAAADVIPKDAQGRFVLNDGGQTTAATVFQGYNLFPELM